MKNKNFLLLLIGQIVSVLGSAVLRFALDLYVLDLTGRADIFATVLAISMVPLIVFTPIGGAIADRFNRRNLMVIFDFCSSAIVLALILLFIPGNVTVVTVAIMVTLLSLVSAMYQPAVQASVPVLVTEDGLAQANGLVNGIGALSALVAPVMGAFLYGIVGIKFLLIISGIAFFLAAIMELFIQMAFVKPEQTVHIVPTIVGDLKDGFAYIIRENPIVLRVIVLAAGLNLFLSSFFMVGAPYVLRITMESSDTMYGVGMALAQVSGVAGALMIGALAPKMKLSTLYGWLLASAAFLLPMALAITPIFLSMGYWPAFIVFNLSGMAIMFFATVVSVFVITEVQKVTPNALLGKVMAIIMTVSQCAVPLGQLMYGGAFQIFKDQAYVPALMAAVFTGIIALIGKRALKE